VNYPSIRIEGGILSPDILERLDDLPGQKPSDFGLDSSAKVKDEIARAWADAQDYWRIFQRKLESLKPESPATTETRQQWMVPLLGLLGYQLEPQAKGTQLNDKNYPISHRMTQRASAPVQIVGYREPSGLDRKPERSNLRMSAHAVVQEYLNLSEQLYGLVTNGRVLRLLRDSSRLIKLSYIEFDLDRIFTDGLFADFAILFRLLHATRLPVTNDTAAESLIERYHQDSLDSGARIRDGLSKAVEQAIRDFGNGFLANGANKALIDEIKSEKLSAEDFYKRLLRLIYRLLFLMVIEERDLVFPSKSNAKHRDIYSRYYSLQRLRSLSEKRYLADPRRYDLWLALMATFRLFEADGPGIKLGLAPLAGDLFGSDAIGALADCTLGNDVLLRCLRSLNVYEHPDNRQLIRVNYAALNVEEFGSVYEGLLEYEPHFLIDGSTIEFDFKSGDERAATGSHYTPDELVQPLIKHSLDYLIADRLKAKDPESVLLDLRVADIACGSGHILLAAARRIATELAVVRTGEEQPSPTAYRAALRDVIRTCIYGVDLNPLAVELCKVALWLEAHNPGQPLNFLDHHIKCGNAIVGFVSRDEVNKGVPDEAFALLPGDDKETAASLRYRNKQERKEKGQLRLELSAEMRQQLDAILAKWKSLSSLPEKTPAEIDAKKREFTAFTTGSNAYLLNQIAAITIAQFYLPKIPENAIKAITDEPFRRYWSGEQAPQGQATAMAWATAHRKRFFHWFLEFPEVMSSGGFDCILGNPPYLGRGAIRSTYGHAFCQYVQWEFEPAGISDLVVFFLRRAYSLVRPTGFVSIITTNSIRDGDVRKDGLDQILALGGVINFAVRGIKWPGRANLAVSLIGIHKGSWSRSRVLDGRTVAEISGHLEADLDAGEPQRLGQNLNRIFQGTIYLGDGFLLTHKEASSYLEARPHWQEVIQPLLNGQELNSHPDQKPGRHIINFRDWSLDKAKSYHELFERVESLVKPDRSKSGEPGKWWQFWRPRTELYAMLKPLPRCFVAATTTKYLSFSESTTDRVFTHALYILASDRWDVFAVVHSSIHEVWARKYSGSLETRLRYSPSDCFETFAMPGRLWQSSEPTLARAGQSFHEYRKHLMQALALGLTDMYNLFHTRALTAAKVAKLSKKSAAEAERGLECLIELRRLHVELDQAVQRAYGWDAGGSNNAAAGPINLAHDFYEVETLPENDRVRYTISPAARKEVLNRLLALNHERAEAEAAGALVVKSPQRKKKAVEAKANLPELFDSADAEQIGQVTAVLNTLALLHSWGSPADRRSFELGMILMQKDALRKRVLEKRLSTASGASGTEPAVGHMDEFLGQLVGTNTLVVENKKTRQLVRLGSNAPAKALLLAEEPGRKAFAKAAECVQAVAILAEQSRALYEFMGAEDYGAIEFAIS